MHCSDQQIHLVRLFSLFNAKTGYDCLDTAKSLDNSLWSLSRSRSKTLKSVWVGAESEYIQPKQERSQIFQTPYASGSGV